jgi:K(+)-stimulated pyrophosphate-energized sodium pump
MNNPTGSAAIVPQKLKVNESGDFVYDTGNIQEIQLKGGKKDKNRRRKPVVSDV